MIFAAGSSFFSSWAMERARRFAVFHGFLEEKFFSECRTMFTTGFLVTWKRSKRSGGEAQQLGGVCHLICFYLVLKIVFFGQLWRLC